eukprot:s3183_g7.t1
MIQRDARLTAAAAAGCGDDNCPEALGCCRDARRPMNKTLHSNCGSLTQFHTPSPDNEAYIAGDGAQTWRGHVELLYDSLESLQAAATRVAQLSQKAPDFDSAIVEACIAEFPSRPSFKERAWPSMIGMKNNRKAKVAALQDQPVTGSTVERATDTVQELWASDAYGNKFALRVASNAAAAALSVGIRPGAEDCKAHGVLGIGSVTLQVPPGTAERGAKFYAEAWATPVKCILVGSVLQEHAACSGQEPRGSHAEFRLLQCALGEHLAIYIQDFDACFERLRQRGLIWVNPRFVHLDKSTNLDEARKYNCFRFKDILAA